VDATIVREGAVAAGAGNRLTQAASAAGSESQQTPTQQREGAPHAPPQASLAGPASGGGAVSSTVAAPPQQGEAALISAPDPLASAPAASQAGGVALQDMIESIHATVEMAARQGMAQARIALEPEELGSLRIHLSQTADGLLARVSADTPAAAQALAGGRAELHQSLSSLGVSLLRLDIGSFSQSDTRDSSGRSTSGESRSSSAAATDPGAESDLVVEHEHSSPTSLGSGALVDVLA
jgi:flagellar hook-length control protein FliK